MGSTGDHLIGESWDSFYGLKSRIIVTVGGGGGSYFIRNDLGSTIQGEYGSGLIDENGTFSHNSEGNNYDHEIATGEIQVKGGCPGGGNNLTIGNSSSFGNGWSANTFPGYWPSFGDGGG